MNGVRMKVFSVALGERSVLAFGVGEREKGNGRLLDEVCHRYNRRGKTNSRTVKRHDENLWVLEERPGELQIIRRDYANPSASLLLHRAHLKSATRTYILSKCSSAHYRPSRRQTSKTRLLRCTISPSISRSVNSSLRP